MLKSTPARKKYTTAGCGGCDKYELCPKHRKQFGMDPNLRPKTVPKRRVFKMERGKIPLHIREPFKNVLADFVC